MAGLKIKEITDYKTSICRDLATGQTKEVKLPKSNVLKFVFDDFSWFALRPSGTEPKLKIYFSATGKTASQALDKRNCLRTQVLSIIK
jgi:phosphoglucomutase